MFMTLIVCTSLDQRKTYFWIFMLFKSGNVCDFKLTTETKKYFKILI